MRRTPMTRAILALLSLFVFGQETQAADPPDLSRLRESWQRAKQQANAPLDKKYDDALRALKLRYTKEGNLEAAIAVDTELKSLTPQSSAVTQPPDTKADDISFRGSQMVLSPGKLKWADAVKWCSENDLTMLSHELLTNEGAREKINRLRKDNTIWIGVSFDFEKHVWLDVDGSEIKKPWFNPSHKDPEPTHSSRNNGGMHANFGGGTMYETPATSEAWTIGIKKS
ncbi:MAG: C-type lectin domain-containing protein [Verrucomicrobiaceae bacterium]|nr:C-type lectin domain-containing protein [Verrucomicrobiaceae bacterium]